MSQTDHFDRIAASYDDLRSTEGLTRVHEAVAREGELTGRRLLDIGCGTGATLALLSRHFDVDGAGVDPSREMLDVARAKPPPEADLRLGTAEKLPFGEARFEAVLMQLVVHHVDRARAFPEAHRVLAPGGRFLIVTPDPTAFPRFWMAALFPSYAAVDQGRFPAPERLLGELAVAGFGPARIVPLAVRRTFDRATALAKLRGRAYSTIDHLPDGEYEAGLERAESELPEQIEYTLELAIVVARR